MLTRSGLGPALTSYAARVHRPGPCRIDPAVADARYAERVEAAAYFCCVEALALRTRRPRSVERCGSRDSLVTDPWARGSTALDRLAVTDRVEACGGSTRRVQATGSAIELPALTEVGVATRLPDLPQPVGAERRLGRRTPRPRTRWSNSSSSYVESSTTTGPSRPRTPGGLDPARSRGG